MKAKRIVSILLTGSMLLSLLPVSALAAAPVEKGVFTTSLSLEGVEA